MKHANFGPKATLLVALAIQLMAVTTLATAQTAARPLDTGLVLSPGIWRTLDERGYEVSALWYRNEQGSFSALGLVFGEALTGPATRYAELEVGGSGWLLASLALGLGYFEAEAARGAQGTLSFQFFTPFFAFVRGRWNSSDGWRPAPFEYGIMIKLPLPVACHNYEEKAGLAWRWGM